MSEINTTNVEAEIGDLKEEIEEIERLQNLLGDGYFDDEVDRKLVLDRAKGRLERELQVMEAILRSPGEARPSSTN